MLHLRAVPDAVRNLLTHLAPLPALADFSLGGGTSLALRFGHRLSVDLDFHAPREFDTGPLAENPGLEPDPVSLKGGAWRVVQTRIRAMVSNLT